jgi:hypothetical protein
MMIELIAVHEIWRGGPAMVATGETGPDGAPVFRRETEVISPETRFLATRAEARELIDAGAAFPAEAS